MFRSLFLFLISWLAVLCKLLHSHLLSAVFDPVFTVLSLQHTLCTYCCIICFLTQLRWAASISWHVSYWSVDGWISEIYVCRYVCMSVSVCVCCIYVCIYVFLNLFIACSITGSNTTCLIVIFTNTMFRDSYIDCFILWV